MADSPSTPLPRASRINSVSAWSSRWCASRISRGRGRSSPPANSIRRSKRAFRAASWIAVAGFGPAHCRVTCGRPRRPASAATQAASWADCALSPWSTVTTTTGRSPPRTRESGGPASTQPATRCMRAMLSGPPDTAMATGSVTAFSRRFRSRAPIGSPTAMASAAGALALALRPGLQLSGGGGKSRSQLGV